MERVNYRKKIIVFMVTVICLLCYNLVSFAESKITMEYNENKNLFCREYEYTCPIEPDVLAVVTYQKYYDFDGDVDQVTHKYKPQDVFIISLLDLTKSLKNIRDELVFTEIDSGKVIVVPTKFIWEQSKDGECDFISDHFWLKDNQDISEFMLAGKPFKITFSFTVLPKDSVDKNLKFVFVGEELSKLKSVVDYDLYADPTQKEKIEKAIVTSISKKVAQEFFEDRYEFRTYNRKSRRHR